MDYFGLLGLVLILLGWIYETIGVLKKGKTNLPFSFAILYGLGSALLTIHSLLLNDVVFLVLNFIATVIALINAFFALKKTK